MDATNKLAFTKAIAKRKKIIFTNILRIDFDCCNVMFDYINRNGKLVKYDMYSFETIGIKPKYE